jgi:peptidoglycan hydrolase CwlO-like protein
MNEFWKKNKKNIIACAIVIVLCGISFTCGRCIRLRGAESNSTGVEQSIGRAELSADKIENGLSNLGSTVGTINGRNDFAIGQVDQTILRVAELQSLVDELIAIDQTEQESFRERVRGISDLIGTADYILSIAEFKAEENERIVARNRELLGLSDEGANQQ